MTRPLSGLQLPAAPTPTAQWQFARPYPIAAKQGLPRCPGDVGRRDSGRVPVQSLLIIEVAEA